MSPTAFAYWLRNWVELRGSNRVYRDKASPYGVLFASLIALSSVLKTVTAITDPNVSSHVMLNRYDWQVITLKYLGNDCIRPSGNGS